MSYHENPQINACMLTIINDAVGSSCSWITTIRKPVVFNYKARCDAGKGGDLFSFRAAVRAYSRNRLGQPMSREEQVEAASRLFSYYYDGDK